MILRLLFAAVLLVVIEQPSVRAVEPAERLADPALEARARGLSKELRCLVCQNQSIDESNADLAHDLRLLLRQRLVAGDTDRQVLDYIAARYGVFVLLDPPFAPLTWVLWLTPPVLVLGGGGLLLLRARRRIAHPGGVGRSAAASHLASRVRRGRRRGCRRDVPPTTRGYRPGARAREARFRRGRRHTNRDHPADARSSRSRTRRRRVLGG
jgi:cytochrome c-type biogenesis protein CcmH